jgi:aspartate aminotransferase
MIDTKSHFSGAARSPTERGISRMARSLIASEILKVAAEIRALQAKGADILNLTVGDFNPKEFPIPAILARGVKAALDAGHTNYPPSNGTQECRDAVRALMKAGQGLDYPAESVLIGSGARPMIAGLYMALVNPGDRVVYPLPSWNNNHYCTLVGAERVEVPATKDTGFFPPAQDLLPHLAGATLIALNTPLNPTGTVMEPRELESLCHAIVAENTSRRARSKPPLYLMFDQVYSTLTFGGAVHTDPVSLVPAMADYTVFVDGISKSCAATGLRVGWSFGPPDVIERMSAILTHLGAWAPRAEQIATAEMLSRGSSELAEFHQNMKTEVLGRLSILASGIEALQQESFDVDCIAPAGAIYLSLRVNIGGKTGPDGRAIRTDEEIRSFLLNEAGIALVPFQAFGLSEDSGWFRASVGAVSRKDCARFLDQLRAALKKLR